MEFKVGDHVKCSQQPICVIIGFNSSNWPIVILHGEETALNPKFTSLRLPEKWAIKTDRQEFYDWFNKHPEKVIGLKYFKDLDFEYYIHLPKIGILHSDSKLHEGYTEITFDYWCRVHRPDLLKKERGIKIINASEIPEKWCVRRTPENAEVLNAYFKAKFQPIEVMPIGVRELMIYSDGEWDYINEWKHSKYSEYPEIPYEQWQTIPEVAEWLKENYVNFFGTGMLIKATVDNRKIIGYISPFDMWVGSPSEIKKGALFIKDGIIYRPETEEGMPFFWLPAEIVESWEPAKEEVTPSSFVEKWKWHVPDEFHFEFYSDLKKMLGDTYTFDQILEADNLRNKKQ